MCERHLELCWKGLPYWGQSLVLPGVYTAKSYSSCLLEVKVRPQAQSDKNPLGSRICDMCGVHVLGAPPDAQGEAGRRLYCTR